MPISDWNFLVGDDAMFNTQHYIVALVVLYQKPRNDLFFVTWPLGFLYCRCICGLFNITKHPLLQCSCQGIRHPRPPAAVLYIALADLVS